MNRINSVPGEAPVFARYGLGLTGRLTFVVLALVAVTLIIFAVLGKMRLSQGISKQQMTIERVARARVAAQMRLQQKLVGSLFERMERETGATVAELAHRRDTSRVLERGNIVAIDLLLQSAVRASSLDGLIAFDMHLNALGSHQPGLDLLAVNEAIASSSLAASARGVALGSEREMPYRHIRYMSVPTRYANAMGLGGEEDQLAIVAVHPVFDGFGDVAALLLGHRVIPSGQTGQKSPFARLARSEKLGIEILSAGRSLFKAGDLPGPGAAEAGKGVSGMHEADGGRLLRLCHSFRRDWRLCIHESASLLLDLTRPIAAAVDRESRALTGWITGLAAASIALATLLAWVAARQVLAPLHQIALAVRATARGNWLAHVVGQNRRDEVGDIARAVVVLQRAIKERERLRADVADINDLRRWRNDIKEALRQCRVAVRQHLFVLSEQVDRLRESAGTAARMARVAQGRTDETRLVMQRRRTVEAVSAVQSIDTLSGTLEQLVQQVEMVPDLADEVVGELSKLEADVKTLLHDISGETVPNQPVCRSTAPRQHDAAA